MVLGPYFDAGCFLLGRRHNQKPLIKKGKGARRSPSRTPRSVPSLATYLPFLWAPAFQGLKSRPLKVDGKMDATNDAPKRNRSLAVHILLWTTVLAVLLGAAGATVALLGVGKWLVREDPLQPTTAIAVLSGNTPDRALEAAQLYYDGYAKEIWLTHPGLRVDSLAELGIRYPAEDDVNTRVLRRVGIPAKAIHVLETPIVNTDQELEVISATLQSRGGQKVIIVTNKAHTRRVHVLWDKYFAGRGQIIVHAVSDDPFQPGHWWKYSGSLTQVVHEVLGIMNCWAGLPVEATPLKNSAVMANGENVPEHSAAD